MERPTPVLGPAVPRSGGALTRALARGILRLAGWRVAGEVPNEPKMVLVGAPHTSMLDFVLTKLTAASLGARLSWVGKQQLFRPPFAALLRWLGGIPVDRQAAHGFVETMVAEFRRRDGLLLAIMAEGTRAAPGQWRSGFFYIAQGADVPMLLVAFDYGRRTMRLGPALRARGTFESELPRIQLHFQDIRGRRDGARHAG